MPLVILLNFSLFFHQLIITSLSLYFAVIKEIDLIAAG